MAPAMLHTGVARALYRYEAESTVPVAFCYLVSLDLGYSSCIQSLG